ncbi:MAG: moderate conductance mechanosensitive channel [Pseudonocardiales bacterium]|nr:moderate conductance mechanosensitive channel [Pseudonocardiales bacterium]
MSSLAVQSLDDVGLWARSSLLEIIFIVTGTILLTRFATWFGARIVQRIDEQTGGTDGLVRSEASKHRTLIAQVLTWVVLVIIYCLAGVMIVQRLGVPLSGFVAPATVAGVALGFGAQRIVQDILAGFFIVIERQYGFGDVIRLSVAGAPAPTAGTVEDVTLRITRIRTLDGEVITTPNGQIVQVTNLSRDWARAVVDVPIPINVDLNRVTDLLHTIGREAYEDETLHPLLLDPPSVMGVESLQVDQFKVRVVARTLPGKQFDVGRALRARITSALLREGITVPAALDTAEPTATS